MIFSYIRRSSRCIYRSDVILPDFCLSSVSRHGGHRAGGITNTTTKRLKDLEARQEELDRQIIIEKSKNAVRVSEEQIRAYYKEALALEAQMLINYLVDEIVMYDDKIEIFFHKPTRNSPDESRGCFVYKGRKENFDVEIWIV